MEGLRPKDVKCSSNEAVTPPKCFDTGNKSNYAMLKCSMRKELRILTLRLNTRKEEKNKTNKNRTAKAARDHYRREHYCPDTGSTFSKVG